MSRRKSATILTIKSLSAFSKVCCTSPKYFNSFKPLSSTATETSYFQNPNGFDGENVADDYPINPNNTSVEFKHNRAENGQQRAFLGNNNREFQQNPNGVYGQTYGIEYQQNSIGGRGNNSDYTQRPVHKFQQCPVGQNGNFNGYCGDNSRPNPSGSNMNSTTLQQNDFNANLGTIQKNPNVVFSEDANMLNPNWFYGPGSRGSVNGHYGESTHQFQQSLNQYSVGNNGRSLQNNPITYNVGHIGSSQPVQGSYYNTGMCQPSQSGYRVEKVGEYQMNNPIGSYQANTGPHQQISNGSQNGLMARQVSSNSTSGGELVEDAESSKLRGTIEELDGFCKEGKLKEAMEVLGLLEQNGIPIDMPRYVMLMKVCGEAKAIEEAKYVHEHLTRSVSSLQVSMYNKILVMYSKCGSMEDAYKVFDKMPQRNLTSWDTMITWLAKNGLGEEAIELFTQFKASGLKPDGQMFFGIFSVCSVVGDISEGLLHFESMTRNYGIVPSMEHYVSVVDMLGSTGNLDEAMEFIEKMPMEPSIDVWETLMNLSRVHGNTELGDHCAEFVELLDPSRLNEQSKLGLIPVKASDVAKEKEKKKVAQNLLEVKSRVHEYRAGDTSHPDTDKIYALLRGMKQQMKEAGYIPETKFVLHDIDQEGKEEALLGHSERLAVAQGLMSSPARSPMRIIKNLRVCGDCHNALKIISKLVGRELIIRDAKRFHHFKDGLCSCRDYW
ncbi:hypothetical protein LguiA_036457 [Lonicera macranthoides]